MRTLMLLILAGLAVPVSSETAPVPSAITATPDIAGTETISTTEDSASRLTVPVMVNGQGPFRFIIDTGSDRSVVSKELAAKLALPNLEKARLISMSGVDEVNMVKVDSIGVTPKRILRDVQSPALPQRYIGADGILGIDALKGQRILIDFSAESMLIEPADTREVREEANEPGTIVVRARSRLGQLVLVDADANPGREKLGMPMRTGRARINRACPGIRGSCAVDRIRRGEGCSAGNGRRARGGSQPR